MNNRERYIDIVKGLSILCIVFLHYEQGVIPSTVNVFIGSFMITAFYVTSGWISAMNQTQRTLKDLIKRRWKQLGIPYLWWTAIILVFDFILLGFGYYDIRFIGTEIYKTVTLRGIGTLWFLPALFGGEIIWTWIKNRNNIYLIIGALIFTILYQYMYGYIFGNKTETIYRIIDAPFRTISNILGAWVGIAFGYYSYMILNKPIIKRDNLALSGLGLALCVFAFITANYLPSFLRPLWTLLAPLFGPLGFILIAKSIQQAKVFDYLNFWGINSLNLMVTHYSITLVLFKIIIENLLNRQFDGWITIICFLVSLPIQHLFVFIINKYARFTLGK